MEPLKISHDAAEAEQERRRAEVHQLEREYEALEDKLTMDVSWACHTSFFSRIVEKGEFFQFK